MINKDYLLRIAERFGRSLAIILQLREYNQFEEALLYIDDLLLKTVGMTTRFINSLSEDMLVQTFSPMGILNVNACLATAFLLKTEGEVYDDLQNTTESYYRYVKSLHLYLTVILREPAYADSELDLEVAALLKKLADYELPMSTHTLVFAYYEHQGQYAKAEDSFFALLETYGKSDKLIDRGRAFYTRLLAKSDMDLQAGNLSREEVEEGLEELRQMDLE
jgi:hypothetical protein